MGGLPAPELSGNLFLSFAVPLPFLTSWFLSLQWLSLQFWSTDTVGLGTGTSMSRGMPSQNKVVTQPSLATYSEVRLQAGVLRMGSCPHSLIRGKTVRTGG